jgi:hypothetical protein
MLIENDAGGVPIGFTIGSAEPSLDYPASKTTPPTPNGPSNVFFGTFPITTGPDSLFTEGTLVSAPRSSPGIYYPVNDGGPQLSGPSGNGGEFNFSATFTVISPLLYSDGSVAVSASAGTYLDIIERFPGNAPNGASNSTNHPGAASTADGIITISGSTGTVPGFQISLADTHELAKDLTLGSGSTQTYGEYGFAYTLTVDYFIGSDLNHITTQGPILTTAPMVDVFALTDSTLSASGSFVSTTSPPGASAPVSVQDAATLAIYNAAVPEPDALMLTLLGIVGIGLLRLRADRRKQVELVSC